MARTPLFDLLQKHLRLARLAGRPGGPSAAELLERDRALRLERWSRRRFLATSLGATAAVAAGCAKKPPAGLEPGGNTTRRNEKTAPRIAIVGGGIAGLHAAHVLRRGGLEATIYEASSRSGGRMLSSRGLLGPGLITELGGEFIDSNHEDMLALVKELELELIDVQDPSEKELHPETYLFGGALRTDEEVVAAFAPLAERLAADGGGLPETIDAEHAGEGNAGKLDRMSIAAYLDTVGARGWMRDLLEVAFVTEFGLDSGEQSALNLLTMLDADTSGGSLSLLGESDERYKVKGGNQLVPDGLARALGPERVKLDHRLAALGRAGDAFRLSLEGPGGAMVDVDADVVLLTLPFTLLREVELRVPLPEPKRRAIAELGYGANAKVLIGLERRVWREKGYAGNVYSDEPFQLAWDSSRLQPTAAAGLTLYSGGKAAIEVGTGAAEDQAKRLLTGFEKGFPGTISARNGKVSRMHWPTYRWTRAAYAAYKPGQWTTLRGQEGAAVGALHFAGEHTSLDWQGFMNGGAESGRLAAEAILEAAGMPVAKESALGRRFRTTRARRAA